MPLFPYVIWGTDNMLQAHICNIHDDIWKIYLGTNRNVALCCVCFRTVVGYFAFTTSCLLACVFQPPRNQNHIVAPVPFLTSLSTYSDVIPSTGCQSHSSCPRSSFPHLYNSLFQRGICGLFHLCRSNFLPIVHSYSQRRDSLWPPAHN